MDKKNRNFFFIIFFQKENSTTDIIYKVQWAPKTHRSILLLKNRVIQRHDPPYVFFVLRITPFFFWSDTVLDPAADGEFFCSNFVTGYKVKLFWFTLCHAYITCRLIRLIDFIIINIHVGSDKVGIWKNRKNIFAIITYRVVIHQIKHTVIHYK